MAKEKENNQLGKLMNIFVVDAQLSLQLWCLIL